MDLKHILVPVDFSEPSRQALQWACELARRYGADLTLLNVYPVPGYVLPDGFVTAGPEILGEVEAKTRESLQEWAQVCAGEGAPETAIATALGQSSSEIVRWAAEHKVDMIVMGAHGRSGLALLLLGSTTDKVVRQAHCPVLVVPPAPRPASK
ncbi:MAG: universal stress protein [Deltaproteobacteria bacterium]|nr:universal stress protein [Deltaproteobacteria bacterium]